MVNTIVKIFIISFLIIFIWDVFSFGLEKQKRNWQRIVRRDVVISLEIIFGYLIVAFLTWNFFLFNDFWSVFLFMIISLLLALVNIRYLIKQNPEIDSINKKKWFLASIPYWIEFFLTGLMSIFISLRF